MRKPLRLIMLAAALLVAYGIMYYTCSTNLPHSSLLQNLRAWHDIYFPARPLDHNRQFLAAVDEIAEEKFSTDDQRFLDFLWPGSAEPVEVEVPYYYSDHGAARPSVQPFDPRLTFWAYLTWALTRPSEKVPFHWSDWVDLSAVNKFVLARKKATCEEIFALTPEEAADSSILAVDKYCQTNLLLPAGLRVTRFPKLHARDKARLLGRLFLFLAAPAPAKIVFLTNSHGAYHVEVQSRINDMEQTMLRNGVVEHALQVTGDTRANVMQAYGALISQPPTVPQVAVPQPQQMQLQHEWFKVDAEQEISDAETGSEMDRAYATSLRHALNNNDPEKLFQEALFLLLDKERLLGDHHDWRFFDKITLHSDRHVAALHRLLKNYLHFCRAHGLVSWIAHGLLLLWYWNGMAFPWDADMDVQMPLRDLHRLGRCFNQTVVVENVAHDVAGAREMHFAGLGAYFVDVGSSITHRGRGNGKNNIDARFIDIHTGLYVDITGLAVSSQRAPDRYGLQSLYALDSHIGEETVMAHNDDAAVYNCRNLHFALLKEISPLVGAAVQNQVSYVPRKFGAVLSHEYGPKAMRERKFHGSIFLERLRLWAGQDVVQATLQRAAPQDGVVPNPPKTAADHLALLQNDWIFREYFATRRFTLHHSHQRRRLLLLHDRDYAAHARAFERLPEANAPMWGDLFTTNAVRSGWDYTKEVTKLVEMAGAYRSSTEKSRAEG